MCDLFLPLYFIIPLGWIVILVARELKQKRDENEILLLTHSLSLRMRCCCCWWLLSSHKFFKCSDFSFQQLSRHAIQLVCDTRNDARTITIKLFLLELCVCLCVCVRGCLLSFKCTSIALFRSFIFLIASNLYGMSLCHQWNDQRTLILGSFLLAKALSLFFYSIVSFNCLFYWTTDETGKVLSSYGECWLHTLAVCMCLIQSNHVSFIYSTANKSDNDKYKKDPHVWHWQRNKIKSYNVCHIVKVTVFCRLGFFVSALFLSFAFSSSFCFLLHISFSTCF